MLLKLCDQQLILNLHVREMAITFEFGKHSDKYFGNLEGHGNQNPLKMKLEMTLKIPKIFVNMLAEFKCYS